MELFFVEFLLISLINIVLQTFGLDIQFQADIARLLQGNIKDASAATVDEIGGFIDDLEGIIGDDIDEHDRVITTVLTTSLESILAAIKVVEDDIGDIVTIDIGQVEAVLEDSQARQTVDIGKIITAAVAPIDQSIGDVSSDIFTLTSRVKDTSTQISEIITILGQGFVQDIINDITNIIEIDPRIFNEVLGIVSDVVGEITEQNGNVLVGIGNIFKDVLGNVIGEITGAFREQIEPLIQIRDAIFHNKDENTAVLETATVPAKEGLGGVTVRSVINEILPGMDLTSEMLKKGMVDFIQGPTGLDCINDQSARDVVEGEILEGAGRYVGNLLAYIASALPIISGLASARAQPSIQDFMECNPTFPLPIAETIIAFQRGMLDEGQAQSNIQRTGIGAEDAEILVNIGFTVPDLALLYNMFYRDLIDDDAFDDLLKASGYTQGMLAPLKELAFFIPPVQDLITMAVREVFSPEISIPNGQFQEFPPEFEKFAKQQGVSAKWAENYWAAHWVLPSIQMGYEMLHRGEISKDELEFLLKALDVMPIWRKRLINISFSPFTRVDIRRMHKVGVLTESEVNKAYHEIGYDDDKAERLTAFTLELNKDEGGIFEPIAEDLTRAAILGFYSDGVIRRSAALVLLVQAGVNIAAAELFLSAEDLAIERRERKADITIVLDRFSIGALDEIETANQLRSLDLESRELALALLDLDRMVLREVKLPSRSELDKFREKGIIDDAEYLQNMRRLGFPQPWPERYLALATGA